MRQERKSIDKLAAQRYLLATSRELTPSNKSTLSKIIGPTLKTEGDIWARGDLNALLRKFPELEKAHIKLWLSSVSVLESVLRSAEVNFTEISKRDITAKIRVYAYNPSFQSSYETLERHRVLIISGPPGVGKSTLAEMLSFAYIAEGWRYIAIRSLEDGFSAIKDNEKQIFFFDDFLGKIALDARGLAAKDSYLTTFIGRVRTTETARFVLTTRAYILEEARRVSEHLADKSLDVMKYILDVGIYTCRIRARILYNHLMMSTLPADYLRQLIEQGTIAAIVDHKNYNPRIVEWMTDIVHVGEIAPNEYPKQFLELLANPERLWDTAFRTHISHKCRHLLFALFFSSQYGVEIDGVRQAYTQLHKALCTNYGLARDPKDFDESVRILEGSFLTITGTTVSFIDPSFRDYLSKYLVDLALLTGFGLASTTARWAREVWRHGRELPANAADRVEFTQAFQNIAEKFTELPLSGDLVH